jgi:hypothetical protein
MLSPEVIDEMRVLVCCGCYDKGRLMAMFCDEKYAPGELSPDDVSSALDQEFEKFDAEKTNWPLETDCDRLDRAFEAWPNGGL